MAVFNKWVALKLLEFVSCVACIVAKRVSDDDSQRLALLLQKFSREWSLLNSVTWDSLGSSFGDAVYGGYTIITFGLLLARIFQEIPRGKRILEGFLLGLGLALFLVLGGLELAALDSIQYRLIVNAGVLGALSLFVALLFLVDLLGPRVLTAAHSSQTDNIHSNIKPPPELQRNNHIGNGNISNANGYIPNGGTTDQVDKHTRIDEPNLFNKAKNGYTKFDDDGNWVKDDIETSKFGSHRNPNDIRFDNGNYVKLFDPLPDTDRIHYERELGKFNERYFRDFLDGENNVKVKEDYLPELQTPMFSKVKSTRQMTLYDDLSPTFRTKRNDKDRSPTSPTLKQLEDYLRGSTRSRGRPDTPMSALFPMEPIEEKRDSIEGARGTPTDPGYVQYTADRWPEDGHKKAKTPRHSPL